MLPATILSRNAQTTNANVEGVYGIVHVGIEGLLSVCVRASFTRWLEIVKVCGKLRAC